MICKILQMRFKGLAKLAYQRLPLAALPLGWNKVEGWDSICLVRPEDNHYFSREGDGQKGSN